MSKTRNNKKRYVPIFRSISLLLLAARSGLFLCVLVKFCKARLNHTNFLGYTKDENDNLVIVPEEAEIVRLIFSLYLDGYGSRKIADYLERNGIKTVTGKNKWSTSTIGRILINEKYAGCLVTQKSYTDNFLDGRQIKNTGEIPQYRFEYHHEAIIDMETFEKVQKKKHKKPIYEFEAPAMTQSM